MNIKEAKEQIENTIKAYLTKDEFGNYKIPIERQRPILVMGPPGIGKTAIMEQIASELGVALISYSMTHHTRQSALGLPFIVKRIYDGQEYSVSEYTMSEIIASVYDMMEKTGLKEGILFLDEINCVSETLTPVMLQFLQYKTFGRHRVPNGWIVVTAGNPPEYNNSVRELDIVTLDRLKLIEVEADYTVWKDYAYKKSIHASIITYLAIKKNNFYLIETTVDGKKFVTARGWSDLSDMILLSEEHNMIVDEKLILQYLQNPKIAKDFSVYYDLWVKYRSDYQIDTILTGTASEEIKKRAKDGEFDERFALLGLMLETIVEEMKGVKCLENIQYELLEILKVVRLELSKSSVDLGKLLEKSITEVNKKIEKGKMASALSSEDEYVYRSVVTVLETMKKELVQQMEDVETFKQLKEHFDKRTANLKNQAIKVGERLSNIFKFCEDVFGEGQEILILVTELTISYYGAHFISRYGCKEYFAHNKELLFYERQKEIIRELEKLDLED